MANMHKKSDYEQNDNNFEPMPDGKYPSVLESVKLDMANKYGPKLTLTLRLPNRRLVWIDLRENKLGKLNGAWLNAKRIGIGTVLTEALGLEYSTEQFLIEALKLTEGLVGNYFEIDLKTFDGNGKQYSSIFGTATDKRFSGFSMPSPAPFLDAAEDIPF